MNPVRPIDGASERDRGEWVRMRRALYGEGDHEREVLDIVAGRTGPLGVFVLPREDGRLAGMVEVGERSYAEGCTTSPVAYLEGWWVDPDARRQGHGRALLRAAVAWARDRGHVEMGSDTDIDNDVSVDAHRALGFEPIQRLVVFRRALD